VTPSWIRVRGVLSSRRRVRPPLDPIDEMYYVADVRPALVARIREYTETTRTALVVAP